MLRQLIAVSLLAIPSGLIAQGQTESVFGLGFGASLVTGTPARPAPLIGDHITGASDNWGWFARATVERSNPTRILRPTGELFWSRLTTSGHVTFNCVEDSQAPEGVDKVCYPAAKVDDAFGATVGVALHRREGRSGPYAGFGGGAAAYRLQADPRTPSANGVTNLRPVYRAQVGAAFAIGGTHLRSEVGFLGSIGRGGGSNRFPMSVTVMF